MKRAEKQRWRSCATSVAPPCMMRRKETPSLVTCAGSAKCKLDGRMIVVRTFDRMDAFTRQVVLSSGPVSIAMPVPTLP